MEELEGRVARGETRNWVRKAGTRVWEDLAILALRLGLFYRVSEHVTDVRYRLKLRRVGYRYKCEARVYAVFHVNEVLLVIFMSM